MFGDAEAKFEGLGLTMNSGVTLLVEANEAFSHGFSVIGSGEAGHGHLRFGNVPEQEVSQILDFAISHRILLMRKARGDRIEDT